LQPDGKIVGAGIIYNEFTNSQFVLVRYEPDGVLDTTFGDAGQVILDNININAIALQPDGKILAAGHTFQNPSDKDIIILRFNENGSLDSGFGTNGKTTSSIGNRDFANAMTLQPDGKILIAGYSFTEGFESDYCLARYDSDGMPDAGFGINGIVTLDVDESDEANAVKIQPDGKIIFAGFSANSNTSSHAMVRLQEDGSLDTGFGMGGMGMVVGPESGMGKSIALQDDGKIILAGSCSNGGSHNIGLKRFQANGAPDTTFGDNGTTTTPFMASCKANALLIQPDAKIVIGGEAGTTGGTYKPDFALARYQSAQALGTPNILQKRAFSIYPNPVNTIVNLEISLLQPENLSVDLYDISGKKIKSLIDTQDFASGLNTQTLELPENLQKGVYFVNVSTGMASSVIKIIK
jgi:uncharacterized delta-60 repeat protein